MKVLKPAVPGDTVRRTRTVVAKSLPVATTGAAACCVRAAAAAYSAGGATLTSAAATVSAPSATSTSADTTRRSAPSERGSRGMLRKRLSAPSAASTRMSPTLSSTKTPKIVVTRLAHVCTSMTARNTPVAATTTRPTPASVDSRRARCSLVVGGAERHPGQQCHQASDPHTDGSDVQPLGELVQRHRALRGRRG